MSIVPQDPILFEVRVHLLQCDLDAHPSSFQYIAGRELSRRILRTVRRKPHGRRSSVQPGRLIVNLSGT